MSEKARQESRDNECIICVNPGGEEQWDRLVSAHVSPSSTFVMLNNAYSTSYDLGNKRGYEEAYYLKRISKGWVFRAFPGNWEAYIEKPDGSVELLQSYKTKPLLREVATLVRDEVRRYRIFFSMKLLNLSHFLNKMFRIISYYIHSHSKGIQSITTDGPRALVVDCRMEVMSHHSNHTLIIH